MAMTLSQKIIRAHLVSGEMKVGEEVGIRIDQTLCQDATGTMALLQFESLGIPRVATELSVNYIDHNTLQTGFENADDHAFLQDISANIGAWFSRPGNGICHQLHLERFGEPGKTLLGSDSHTPTGGGIGMLAIGAGGLDVAVAMGGGPFYLSMPRMINVRLSGRPAPWVSAKDIILEVLRRLTVKGGVKAILEYSGEGISYLSVPDRATITNMGAELGATSSLFPSDQVTREFLKAQGREAAWQPLAPDPDAVYDQTVEIDLAALTPMIACPHSPDNVKKVAEVAGLQVDQVMIGSCTNSSFQDMTKVAAILKGKKVHPDVSLVIACGSRQVLKMLTDSGALGEMIDAGARILECTCGPCIGMGQSPRSKGVSLRTINRNFKGRSGTEDAQVYLVSPETAAVSALTGVVADPAGWGEAVAAPLPARFAVDDSMFIPPGQEARAIRRGPNIKALPINSEMAEDLEGEVLIKVGDNITTDHIMPAGAKILPLRSNIPAISEHVFELVDPEFAQRAKAKGGGLILAGENYGQGSSREHAALAPMYLGIKAVIAKSIARIHHDNLINFGIAPLVLADPADYSWLEQGHKLLVGDMKQAVLSGDEILIVRDLTAGRDFQVRLNLSQRQRQVLAAGGTLNWTKQRKSAE